MLVQLNIENFALIDRLTLAFGPGLNVLTGETGAGKSIIIDAIKIALAGRASTDFIRAGSEKALVEAMFETSQLPEISEFLTSLGIEAEEDGTLLLSREFTRGGKNTCRINGRLVTLSAYREVGSLLIDIHGQHDYHSLLQPHRHLALLDSLGGENLRQELEKLAHFYQAYREKEKTLEALGGDTRDLARQMDLLRFQIAEIEEAQLSPGEEEELRRERLLLQNAEKLATGAQRAYALLNTGGSPGGEAVVDLLAQAMAQVQDLAQIDGALVPLGESLAEALYILEDKAREIRNYAENLDFNPGRLEEIEGRLTLIKKLKSKYGDTVEEILAFQSKARQELVDIEGREERVLSLQEEIQGLAAAYHAQAQIVTGLRKKTARFLEEGVKTELASLGMAGTAFSAEFGPATEMGRQGMDKVEFLFSPNPGEPLKPLAKIASGGELSRVMLALKTVLARVDQVPTLIFDEVDAGIGGQAAGAVAEKLRIISKTCQVLCVTHSAQIATFARQHYFIYKEVQGERTFTRVIDLNYRQRVQEIARMLGGIQSETALQHAEEMLKLANNSP